MSRCKSTARGLLVLLAVGCALGADHPESVDLTGDDAPVHRHADEPDLSESVSAAAEKALSMAAAQTWRMARRLVWWYFHTPPAERVVWGGMIACAGFGLGVLLERLARLRTHRIVPADFTAQFLDRLHEGKLDCGQALDHCERNPSPAASVALAAVRRWGRPPADLERAVAMAHRVESDRLKCNVGTLRRIALLTPLLGMLGSIFAVGHALEGAAAVAPVTAIAPATSTVVGTSIAWGPLLAAALTPLSMGLILAMLALVAYDGLQSRIEKLAGSLDRLGAEIIDAIALAAPSSPPAIMIPPVPAQARTPHQSSGRRDRRVKPIGRSNQPEAGA